MSNACRREEVEKHPVVYAGRFTDQVTGTDLPGDCIILGEQDALPRTLIRVLQSASILVFLDLLSFSFEALLDEHWGIPMIAVLPSGFGAESLVDTFDKILFERLSFFDYITTLDSTLWEELRWRYCWAESQRLLITDNHPGEVATAVCSLLRAGPTSTTNSNRDQAEAARYWNERNRMLAASGTYWAVHDTDSDPRFNKALHRVQAAALEPQFTSARDRLDVEVPLDVLEVGAGLGRWASSFDPKRTRFVGIDRREDLVKTARTNFPEQRFDLLSPDLRFPYDDESFDLVFSVAFMHRNPEPDKRTLLSEMWRVTRPSGRLLFLEDFVFPVQLEQPDVYPVSVTEFVTLIIDATAGQVVLEHMESLRYPDEDLRRGGLLSLLRLGVPGRDKANRPPPTSNLSR